MACQECGGDVYPDEGWYHVDGDDHHEAVPADDDIDNDEYGQHRDPAAAYDEYKHRRANSLPSVGDGGAGIFTQQPTFGGKEVATSVPGAIATMGMNAVGVDPIASTSATDVTPLNKGPMAPAAKTSLRHAARAFIATENTTDRGELVLRAARYIENLTGAWSREASRAAVAVFAAEVSRMAGRPEPDVEEWENGHKADDVDHRYEPDMEREGSRRTAAVLADFDDSLLFGD
jgi:hypothetical protein